MVPNFMARSLVEELSVIHWLTGARDRTYGSAQHHFLARVVVRLASHMSAISFVSASCMCGKTDMHAFPLISSFHSISLLHLHQIDVVLLQCPLLRILRTMLVFTCCRRRCCPAIAGSHTAAGQPILCCLCLLTVQSPQVLPVS